ncbi:MAG: cation:proton antiporter [Bacteroidales bacterium]|nr:cation:proton antiporter [Bacteroidales bacterium]
MQELPSIFYDLAVILITAGVTTVIFKWLKQPLVLGYILAGFFIGPYFPWFPAVTDDANVHVWSDIGIVFLMFALGLEFSLRRLRKVGATGAITALTELAAMFLIGSSVGRMLGFGSMECVFLGAMLSISSTTIIIKSFDDLKLKQQKFTGTVTAVLVVEDLIAVVLIVVLSTMSVSKSVDGGAVVFSILKLIFFLIAWFIFGIYLIPTFLRWMRRYMTEETLLVVAVGLCFGMVVLADKAGFSTALGAFVMGAILAETIEVEVIHNLITPLKNLFGAVFFVSVGMLVNPSVLVKYIVPILVIALTVILFKSTSATLGVLLSGRPLKTAIQSGFCFCQIGEFSFIIAGLGLSFGVIRPELYPIIVSVSILTTFVTPYMIKGALPFYNFIEPRLPKVIKKHLESYSEHSRSTETDSVGIANFIRRQLTNIVVYGVILATIAILSRLLLRPTLNHLFSEADIPQIWSRLLGLIITLTLMAPFLWAVAVKNVSAKKIKEMFDTYRFSQVVVIPLLVLRYFTAILFVGIAVSTYINMAVGFLGVIGVSVVLGILYTRRSSHFYSQIEERFKQNFNSRQAQNAFRLPPGMENDFAMERLHLSPYSPLAGKRLHDIRLRETYGVNIVTIERGENVIDLPTKEDLLLPTDTLTVIGTDEQITRMRTDVEVAPEMLIHDRSDHEMHMYRYHVEEGGPLCGLEIYDSEFNQRHHALIIAIERNGEKIFNPDHNIIFQHDDLLWFVSPDKQTITGFEKKMIEV